MKLDIKTIITLLTIAAALGGFYYTTNMRLDSLEDKIAELEATEGKLKKLINRKHRGAER
jgi:hypothetical protein